MLSSAELWKPSGLFLGDGSLAASFSRKLTIFLWISWISSHIQSHSGLLASNIHQKKSILTWMVCRFIIGLFNNAVTVANQVHDLWKAIVDWTTILTNFLFIIKQLSPSIRELTGMHVINWITHFCEPCWTYSTAGQLLHLNLSSEKNNLVETTFGTTDYLEYKISLLTIFAWDKEMRSNLGNSQT